MTRTGEVALAGGTRTEQTGDSGTALMSASGMKRRCACAKTGESTCKEPAGDRSEQGGAGDEHPRGERDSGAAAMPSARRELVASTCGCKVTSAAAAGCSTSSPSAVTGGTKLLGVVMVVDQGRCGNQTRPGGARNEAPGDSRSVTEPCGRLGLSPCGASTGELMWTLPGSTLKVPGGVFKARPAAPLRGIVCEAATCKLQLEAACDGGYEYKLCCILCGRSSCHVGSRRRDGTAEADGAATGADHVGSRKASRRHSAGVATGVRVLAERALSIGEGPGVAAPDTCIAMHIFAVCNGLATSSRGDLINVTACPSCPCASCQAGHFLGSECTAAAAAPQVTDVA